MTNNKEAINLFFAVDDNYCPFLSVAIDSIIDNANKNYNYHIFVLTTYISEYNQNLIKSRVSGNFSIEFINIKNKLASISEKLFTRDYYSKTTYYRLFIPNMFPNLNKALYLDSDIIVCGDISKLYNTNLKNNLAGAVTDSAVSNNDIFIKYVEECVGVHFNNYFNAGILLMNLEEMRKFDFENKFLDLLSKYQFTVAQDQDYLNVILKNKITYIDSSWNVMPIKNNKITIETINLVHYNMLWKPWQFDEILYEEYFWQYVKNNPFCDVILDFKNNFTKDKQQQALSSGESLLALAQSEALSKTNFKNTFLTEGQI